MSSEDATPEKKKKKAKKHKGSKKKKHKKEKHRFYFRDSLENSLIQASYCFVFVYSCGVVFDIEVKMMSVSLENTMT